ncbi:MAG: ABC transporter ATP-binding protein [Robiginitomaculum sp.]|nr:ABC transporter ATP-binding protein [Robiginitomaculum sp.]MDQ7077591.1 ABC transporter ATP-binding protein [Robiginitomaculum sp.]
MTSNATPPQPLLHASKLTLHIPIIRPKDRQLLSNPARFLIDLYFSRTNRDVVTILDKVSFTLNQGERIGIIGANGAGKSTLLRLLAGIYAPSSGTLEVNGTVKGLFSISLGMYPEATGLENIYMRGLQMGLKLQEIKEMVPEVVEFAELQDAIENPLNTYSTGMRTRLAFSISTMIEPDILLLDEWIGAGDARFRDKVQARMNRLVEDSRGLVLATHNTGLMKRLCTKGLVLSKGKMAYYGDLEEALEVYTNDKKLQARL